MTEDFGLGDVTAACLEPDAEIEWFIEAQQEGVVCGVAVAMQILSPGPDEPDRAFIEFLVRDSAPVRRGTRILEGRGNARRILAGERTALNFLMHLSGIATLTATFVEKVRGTGARIVDTRKTLPGLRVLEKYAVRCGGGYNHRMGLYDGAMIKDNHIQATGSIRNAVHRIRETASHMTKIEVECESIEQVQEAIDAGADVVMLDNMDPFSMREIVKQYQGKTVFEASGGVNLETVRGVAQTGVDLISVGMLTHSAPAVAFHLEISS